MGEAILRRDPKGRVFIEEAVHNPATVPLARMRLEALLEPKVEVPK